MQERGRVQWCRFDLVKASAKGAVEVKTFWTALLALFGAVVLAQGLARAGSSEVAALAGGGGEQLSQRVQLVMLEEDGCPWCEAWNRDAGVIYEKTAEGRVAPLRRIDIHDPLPTDLAFLTPGNYTPTFILVRGNKEIGRIRGYPGEDFFWVFLGQLIDRLKSEQIAQQHPLSVN